MPAKNGSSENQGGKYTLQIPLDASGVRERGSDRGVKVAIFNATGQTQEQTVRFDKSGAARATFGLRELAGNTRVVVGPEDATTEQLKGMQTIVADVPSRQWAGKDQLTLNPIIISNYYWLWWLRWCRRFRITGKVVCANGDPVAGAQVCAYDVDWWWWWWSRYQVGCATTDINGSFEIDFTHCCGWWPWWWWRYRVWQLNPVLVERIIGVLRQDPRLTKIPAPSPQPDPQIFQVLLNAPGRDRNQPPQLTINRLQQPTGASKSRGLSRLPSFDPAKLDSLRTDLLKMLPPAPEFEHLRLWPWWPWYPWWDCDADIVFEVTQDCQGSNKVIVNESIWDTHWDIPTDFSVTLTANDQACCVWHCVDECPNGNCLLPTDICFTDNIGSIGGNEGAIAASPVGLLNPGKGASLSYGADRPYAGSVPIYGSWGDQAQLKVDYYELMVYYAGNGSPAFPDPVLPPSPLPSPPIPASSYSPMPTPTFAGFDRLHLVFTPLPHWPSIPFHVQSISDGTTFHNVIETIAHYEATNGPQLWDSGTHDLLAIVNTVNNLANGTYYVQIRGWQMSGSGTLLNPQILPICGSPEADNPVDNYWVFTVDNQMVAAISTPQGLEDINGLHCGLGTVHQCTGQPESAILQVQILHQDQTTTPIGPCANVCIVDTDQVIIDFVAYDPDYYLAYYTMDVVYGASLIIDLLSLGGTITPSPIAPPYAPATSQVGPDYGTALSQVASAPWWNGGAMRLTVPATAAFPETCAYELQLFVHKRTISGCDHSFWNQWNQSGLSFTIVNPCPSPAIG
jgi:hypothetical protein